MADEKKTGFGEALGKVIDDVRGSFKLGLGGLLIYCFLKDPPGRSIIAQAKNLGGKMLKRFGIEAEPLVEDVKGWFIERINAVRTAFLTSLALILGATIAYLWMVAYNPFFEQKAILAVIYLGAVIFLLHDLWAQAWTLTLALAVPAGLITQAQAIKLERFSSLLAVAAGGAKEIASTGLAWISNEWKWIGAFIVWVTVGTIYTVIMPLFNIPGMIPFGLLFVPIFVIIPLVWNWDNRGSHYNWLLWAGVVVLIFIGLFVSFKSELWLPLTNVEHGLHTWAKVMMWAAAAIAAFICIRVVQNANRGRQTGATAYGLPRDRYRPPTNHAPFIWGAVVLMIFTILVFKYGFGDKVNPVMSKNVFPMINSAVGGQLLPTGPDVEDDFVRNSQAPLSVRPLPNGWTEVIVPAGLGNFQLPITVQAGRDLEYQITDGTYTVDFGPRHADLFSGPAEVTTSGLINGRRYPIHSFRWMSTYIIKGDESVGTLLMRAGRSGTPFNMGKNPHGIYKTANPLAREVFLATNLFQLRNEPGYRISGTYTLQYRIVKRPV